MVKQWQMQCICFNSCCMNFLGIGCVYMSVFGGGGSGGKALWPPHHLVQCLSFKFGFLPLYLPIRFLSPSPSSHYSPWLWCTPSPPGHPFPPLLLPLVTMTRSDFFDNWLCLMWSTWLDMFLHNLLYFLVWIIGLFNGWPLLIKIQCIRVCSWNQVCMLVSIQSVSSNWQLWWEGIFGTIKLYFMS